MMEIWFSNIYLVFNNIYYAYIEFFFCLTYFARSENIEH